MADLPLLSMTIFLPLMGALVIFLNWGKDGFTQANNARRVALWTSLVTLGLAIILCVNFNNASSDFQFEDKVVTIHKSFDNIKKRKDLTFD